MSLTPLKVPGQKVVIFKGNVSGSAATAGLPVPRRVCLLRAGTLAQRGTPPFHPPVFRGFFFNFWSKISALLIVAKMVCFPGFPWGWWWWGLAQNVGCQAVPPRAAPRHSQTLLPDPANRICFFVHCCTLCARLSTVLWHDNLNTERPKMFAQTQISPSKCSSSALLTRVPKKKSARKGSWWTPMLTECAAPG